MIAIRLGSDRLAGASNALAGTISDGLDNRPGTPSDFLKGNILSCDIGLLLRLA
jgi:hypothetical protein